MDNFDRKARRASVRALASDELAKRREKCALRQARIAPTTAAVAASRRGCVLPCVFEAVPPFSADGGSFVIFAGKKTKNEKKDKRDRKRHFRRSGHVRFAPIAPELVHCGEMTLSSITGCEQSQQDSVLFDHLVFG
jgi:hypothetical protein